MLFYPVCAKMLWFPSMGTDVHVTSSLEIFTTLQHVSNESSVKVKVSADLVDHVEFKGSKYPADTVVVDKVKHNSSARTEWHAGLALGNSYDS